MAEFTKGLGNLQEAITACQQASTAVATTSTAEAAQARSALESVLASLNEVSDKFFIKTMMSVPPTKPAGLRLLPSRPLWLTRNGPICQRQWRSSKKPRRR